MRRLIAAAILMVSIPVAVMLLRSGVTPPERVGEQSDASVEAPAMEIITDEDELKPLTEEEFLKLQEDIRDYERQRPRFKITATQKDIDSAVQLWGRKLVETDLGSSIVDGGPLPVHAKIEGVLFEADRRRDLEAMVRELAARVASLEQRSTAMQAQRALEQK